MNDQVIDEYNAAVGLVVAARSRYAAACESDGEDSPAAAKARGELNDTLEHRDEMRKRHDSAPDARRS